MNYYNDFYDGLNDKRNSLYREIDTVTTLNKLLATIYCEKQNICNYKINLVGETAFIYKKHLTTTIIYLEEAIKKIEELIKIKNGYPLYQLNDLENVSIIKTIPSMDYKISQIYNNIKTEFKTIKELTKNSIESANREGDYSTINILSNILIYIDKLLLDLQ